MRTFAGTIPNGLDDGSFLLPRYARPWRLLSLACLLAPTSDNVRPRIRILDGENVALCAAMADAACTASQNNSVSFFPGATTTPQVTIFDSNGPSTVHQPRVGVTVALPLFVIEPEFQVILDFIGGGSGGTVTAIRFAFDFPFGEPLGMYAPDR